MDDTRRRQQRTNHRTSLYHILRDRYARGEVTDEEFKLKRLLETEDVPTENQFHDLASGGLY